MSIPHQMKHAIGLAVILIALSSAAFAQPVEPPPPQAPIPGWTPAINWINFIQGNGTVRIPLPAVTCMNGKPVRTVLVVTRKDDDISIQVVQEDASDSGLDCSYKPPRQNDVNESQVFRPTLGGFPQGQVTAHADAGQASFLNVPYRDFPFPLIYPNLTNAPSADCNPNNNANAFAVDHVAGLVYRIATCAGKVLAKIPVAPLPLQVAVTPDGSTAIVTSYASAISFIDTATNKVTILNTDSTINPSGIAISPDGSRAYITSFIDVNPLLLTLDIASRKIIASVTMNQYPQSVSLSPDGSLAYVTHPLESEVYVVDTFTNLVTKVLNITSPVGIAFNPTGTRAYITSYLSPGVLTVVDTSTNTPIQALAVGNGATDVRVTPDGSLIVVNCELSSQLSFVDPVTLKVATVAIQGSPSGLTFVP